MITVAEALAYVLQQQNEYGIDAVPLLQCAGRMLARDVCADRDYPAFDRVMMDGIAIRSAALQNGVKTFKVQAVQAAGDAPLTLASTKHCVEIMTGAVLPQDADVVIPYEEITLANNVAVVNTTNVQSYQNIHKKGIDKAAGTLMLAAGTQLTAAHTSVLASVGMGIVPVKRLPRVAVCSTGNELVDIDAQPLPHQIRRSNQYMLAALLQSEHITPALHHLPDDKEVMTTVLSDVIHRYDVVLLSGAVSKGKYDYLPAVLESLGMKTIFHRIAQRPGKPMLFGKLGNGTLVFGLPGNPISTFACYQIYFKAWLYKCLQHKRPVVAARLAGAVVFKPNLSYH